MESIAKQTMEKQSKDKLNPHQQWMYEMNKKLKNYREQNFYAQNPNAEYLANEAEAFTKALEGYKKNRNMFGL